ncbi:MAG: P1 family peptidase, partial [Mycobacterium leprae]
MTGRGRWRQRAQFLGLVGVLVPACMIAAGTGIRWLFRRQSLGLTWPPAPHAVAAGVLMAVLSLGLIALLPRLHPSLERALRDTGTRVGLEALEEQGYLVMGVAVVLAAAGEEALFRGGLQPVIGLLPTALLFGFSHGGWRRAMWVYAAAASASGALFGLLYAYTGNLWAPMTAHALHNLASTVLMGRRIDISWKDGRLVVRLVPEEDEEPAQEAPMEVDTMRATARESGLVPGILPPGPGNNLCDVPGVGVGHATVVEGSGPLVPGVGPVRTGVTAIVPHGGNLFTHKVPAGLFVLNGFGKSTGLAQIQELGTLETPIVLANTLGAFRV